MQHRCLRTGLLSLLLLLSFIGSYSATAQVHVSNHVKIVDDDQVSERLGHNYAPSILLVDGVYHAFYCSTGKGTDHWDRIRYTSSRDGRTWRKPKIMLKVSGGTSERAACDPSVVFYGGYYYMFYTGSPKNVQGSHFVARSASITGPYAKYTHRGTWEIEPKDPKVIIRPANAVPEGVAGWYGAGQATVVVKDGRLHMWYFDDTENYPNQRTSQIRYTTTTDPINWNRGVATNLTTIASVDVKYDPVLSQFVMVSVDPAHLQAARLDRYSSRDGVNWRYDGGLCDAACFPDYTHNPGLSGDRVGYLLAGPTLVGYGAPYDLNPRYQNQCKNKDNPHGSDVPYCWGYWDLYGTYVTPSPSLLVVQRNYLSNKMRVISYDGLVEYKQGAIVETTLEMDSSDQSWAFARGDYNRDGIEDVYAIAKHNTGTHTTEVHVLDGRTSFKTFLVHTGTALHETGTDGAWDFDLGDYNRDGMLDLFAISKHNTGTRTTQIHVLNGADQFQTFLLHTGSALHLTGNDNSWDFMVADYNNDSFADVFALNKNNTELDRTIIHILNGASGYQDFLLNEITPIVAAGTDGRWNFGLADYNSDGIVDLYGIVKHNTGSGKTEVHVVNGADQFQTFLLHKALPLGPTGTDYAWVFLM